jgi:MFS family permease
VIDTVTPDEVRVSRAQQAQTILVTGKFLTSLAYFATLPYLTIYLSDHAGLSKPAAGAIAGLVALISALGGSVAGGWIDRWGAVPFMTAAMIAYAGVYAGLAFLRTTGAVVALLALMGVVRMVLEPATKKLMSATAGGAAANIFRIRYMVVSAGAIGGPLIGALLYHLGPKPFFLIPGCALVAYLVLIVARRPVLTGHEEPDTDQGPRSFRSALRDRRLLLITATGLVFFTVFGQFDSMLPLLLHDVEGGRAVGIYSAALIADAVLAIGLQKPIVMFADRVPRRTLVTWGAACIAASFPLFAASGTSLLLLAAGVLLFALGESVLMPMPDIYLHETAPAAARGAYFGFGELRYLGFFVGPVLGGWVLSAGHLAFGAVFALAALGSLALFRTSEDRITD